MRRAAEQWNGWTPMKWRLDAGQIEVVDDVVAEILRTKSTAERVSIGMELNRVARLRIKAHLRTIHPDWEDDAIQAEIARRMLLGSA